MILPNVCCLTLFLKLYYRGQCSYPCFPTVSFTSSPTPCNIFSKLLAGFPHNHSRGNGQWWKRTESCLKVFHQSFDRNWPHWGSNQQPSILYSPELQGYRDLAGLVLNFCQLFTTQSQLLTTRKRSLLKTLWVKEKMLVTSIFPFPTMLSNLPTRKFCF